ncbi:muconolactone Delta-isomerase family protein [Sediminitomix flava]|uniref:Muconolactone delta-isomerase n=1 Tax=Sediminitomix flava TaxID=379075 RepID=A0A315ZGI5_SEDFL|nr:muconolactone Delta-isomerase family protein [Sediminitomix flava]PWJ44696.1 muconolactone delta-isomerase [Sediminitomix flava]
MNTKYLIEIDLPENLSDQFEDVLTLHHHRIEEMIMSGTLVSYSESFEDNKIWLVFEAEEKSEALEYLSTLPIIDFVEFDIFTLSVHEQKPIDIPSFSLN